MAKLSKLLFASVIIIGLMQTAHAEYGDHSAMTANSSVAQRNDDGSYGSGNSFSAYTSMSPMDQKALFDGTNAVARQMRWDNSFIGKVFNFFQPYHRQYPGMPYNQPRGAVCDCRGFGGWSWVIEPKLPFWMEKPEL